MVVYQSEFPGAIIDARLAAVATMQTAISNLESAVAAKYSKPSSGIPETDLDASVQAALALARTAIQSLSDYYTKAQVDDITAAIAASVNSTSGEVVTTLPSAGAGTLGKMYYVGPDANGFYDRYVTSYDGSTYTWLALGNTEIDMTQYATVEQLNQLDQKVEKVAIPMLANKSITLGSTIGATINLTPNTENGWYCGVQDCVAGDIFYVNGQGGNNTRLWGIVDASNKLLAVSGAGAVGNNTMVVAPPSAAKFVTNSNGSATSYFQKNQSLFTEVENMKGNIFEKKNLSSNLFDKTTISTNQYVNYSTGQLAPLSGYCASDFIPIVGGETYIEKYTQQIAFYDADKQYISGVATPSGGIFTAPANAAYVRTTQTTSQADTQQVCKGSTLPAYEVPRYGYPDMAVPSSSIIDSDEVVTITATRNASDYNSIREIMAGITDASPAKRYVIFVPKGRWFECDLRGKAYVSIVGEDRDETVIYCDGTSSNLTPSDYYFGQDYSNKPLNTLGQTFKHIIFVTADLVVKNLTLEANDCKYCVHADNTDYKSLIVDNCRMIAKANVSHPIGIGIRGGQTISVTNSILEHTVTGQYGAFAHNWNNQSAPSIIVFDKCFFKNCGFVNLDELGSEQEDAWQFTNCYSDRGGAVKWMVDFNSQGYTHWINGNGQNEANPQNVPYCIKPNFAGSNVGAIYLAPWGGSTQYAGVIARPNAVKYMAADNIVALLSSSYAPGYVLRGFSNGLSLKMSNTPGVGRLLGIVQSVIDDWAYAIVRGVVVVPKTSISGIGASVSEGTPVYANGNALTLEQTDFPVGVVCDSTSGDDVNIAI